MGKQIRCTRLLSGVVQGIVLLMIGAAIGISVIMKITSDLFREEMRKQAVTIEHMQRPAEESSRRLNLFMNIAPAASAQASTGCIMVSANMTLDLATKSCNGLSCPACAIFPYDAGILPVTLTLYNCSTALVGAANHLGDSSVFTKAMMDFRFVNLRTLPVRVATGGAMPLCTYAGREFYTVDKGKGDETACGHGLKIGGGPLSIAFTARVDKLLYYGQVFQFHTGTDFINMAIAERTSTFYFQFKDSLGVTQSKNVPGGIVLGQTNRYLMTIGSGFLRLYRDGVVLAEKAITSYPPRKEWIGTIANGKDGTTGLLETGFDGLVQDLWVYDSEVAWEGAIFEGSHTIPAGRSAQASCVTLGASGSTKAANRLVFDDTRVITGK